MKPWIDVRDGAGNIVGEGPVYNVRDIRIARALDGAGTINITVPGTDKRGLLLDSKRRMEVWIKQPNSPKRYLGGGIIDDIGGEESASGWSRRVGGPDLMELLKYPNVGLGYKVNNQPLASTVAALVALAGWTADTTGVTGNISARFDGGTVLKALQELAARQGYHLRLSDTTPNLIEFKALGTDSCLRIFKTGTISPELELNDDVAVIERLGYGTKSDMVANWIVPLGAGDADPALTLKYSTRTTPYAIQEVTRNGRIHYVLSDATSIAAYGQIERIFKVNSIAPLSNSQADLINAANALYDATVNWLLRYKQPQTTYTMTARKVRKTLRPGDKIRLVYQDYVWDGDIKVNRVDIDALFWVLKVTERVGVEGAAVDLEIADVDRPPMDEAKLIVGAVEQIHVNSISVKTYYTKDTYKFSEAIDATHPIEFTIPFDDATLALNRCFLTLRTRPFRATAKSVALSSSTTSSGGASVATSEGGGVHNHRVLALTSISGFPATSLRPYLGRQSNGGAFLYAKVETNNDSDLWTEGASDSHSHNLNLPAHSHGLPSFSIDYGIEDDSQHPSGIRVYVDNVEVSGGPFAPSGGALNVSIILTDLLADNLQQDHIIRIECTGGQGQVDCDIKTYETIQSVILD